MGILAALRNWWVRTQGGEVVQDFGVIDSTGSGMHSHETRAKLRHGEDGYCLQLQLMERRSLKNTTVRLLYLYFQAHEQLSAIVTDVKRRIDSMEGPTGEKLGPFMTKFLNVLGKKVIHDYGRIDHHPANNAGRRVELALLQGDDTYSLFFCLQKRSYFDWPASLAEALCQLLGEIKGITERSDWSQRRGTR